MVDIAALDPSVFDVGVKSKPAARATLVDGTALDVLPASGRCWMLQR